MERQEAALAGWLAAHPGYLLQEALVDPGVSAGRGKHRATGALGRFIRAAQAGTVPPGSVLIVESLTRFSREAERHVLKVLLTDFWDNNLGLAICGHDEIYTAELIDSQPHRLYVLLALMQQARAEWLERSRRSKGARAAQRAKQDAGIRTPGRVPFWILRDENNRPIRDEAGLFQLDPQGAETVRRMADLYLTGHGSKAIAVVLNEQGVPTRSTAQHWRGEEIRKILAHPAIMGTLRRAAGNVPGYFPAVVDAVTFNKIAQLSKERDLRSNLKGYTTIVSNLFQGCSVCSVCGGPVSSFTSGRATRTNRKRYVGCRRAAREAKCTHRKYVQWEAWEKMGLALLGAAQWTQLLARPEDQANLAQLQRDSNAAQSHLIALAQQLETTEARASEAWLTGANDERLRTIERSLAAIREQHALAEQAASALAQQLAIAKAQPAPADQAQQIRQRLQEFIPTLQDPTARRTFNRWLKAQQPAIRFVLHPGERMELQVGEASSGVHQIDTSLASLALALGGGLQPDGRGGGGIELGEPSIPADADPNEWDAWAASAVD